MCLQSFRVSAATTIFLYRVRKDFPIGAGGGGQRKSQGDGVSGDFGVGDGGGQDGAADMEATWMPPSSSHGQWRRH